MNDRMLQASYEAEPLSLAADVIRHSFETTHIWPFSGEAIIRSARENAGIVDHGDARRLAPLVHNDEE